MPVKVLCRLGYTQQNSYVWYTVTALFNSSAKNRNEFTHSHVVPNPDDLISSVEHKR